MEGQGAERRHFPKGRLTRASAGDSRVWLNAAGMWQVCVCVCVHDAWSLFFLLVVACCVGCAAPVLW